MAGKLNISEVKLISPNGLVEKSITLDNAGVVYIDGKEKANVVQEVWHEVGATGEPTFQNGWVNYNTALYPKCTFMKDSLGFVHLSGLVKSGIVGNGGIIFTLPIGYRPLLTNHTVTISNDSWAFCRVDANGNIVAYNGSSVWYSLDCITFKAEQ